MTHANEPPPGDQAAKMRPPRSGRQDQAAKAVRQDQAAKSVRQDVHRAENLIRDGRKAEGEAILEAVLRAYPAYFTARTVLAGQRFADGRIEETLTLLEGALRLDPDNSPLLVRIGQIEKLVGFTASAASRFRQAILVDPANLDAG